MKNLWSDNLERARERLSAAVAMEPEYSAARKLFGNALADLNLYTAVLGAFDLNIEVAESKGEVQVAKEMKVFHKRIVKAISEDT